MNNRYRREKRTGPFWIALVVVAALALALHLYFANSTKPIKSLASAIEKIETDKFLDEGITYLLRTASQDPLLADWANYYLGIYFERKGEFSDATEAFSTVDKNSAPSLLAQLSLLRVSESDKADSESRRILGELETKAQELNWQEPLAEIKLLRARDLLQANDTNSALTLLNTVRNSKVELKTIKEARELAREIVRSVTSLTPSVLLEQATLLTREGKHGEAMEIIESLKQQLSQDSKAYFEAALVEEEILRAMKRASEADYLLLTISANGPAGSADEALYRIAKNYWNINDHRRALEFIDNLYNRFPDSAWSNDARYMEARILEEMQEQIEAIAVYQALSQAEVKSTLRFAAYKRLAWLNYLRGDYRDAKQLFNKSQNIAKQALINKENDGLSFADFIHALYWEAVSTEKLNQVEQSLPLFEKVFQSDPLGYYRMLAAEKLNRSILPAMQSDEPRCSPEIDEELKSRLDLLKEEKLYPLAQREIEWNLFKQSLPAESYKLTRALLLGNYGSAQNSIRSATQLLNSETFSERGFSCHEKLFLQSFPLLYEEIVLPIAEKENVDPALVFGIMRTESHFDPAAKSSSDARGLMQLLPSTAKSEGMAKEESLYDPNPNIRLGAKHINRLLSQYKEPAQAIAAYNAGSGPVNRWIDRYNEIPIEEWIELIGYPETLNYVKSVIAARTAYKARLQQTLAKTTE